MATPKKPLLPKLQKPTMTEREYQSRREWIIDTAETPADKANLKKDLAKLDAQYKRTSAGITGPGGKNVKPLYK